MLPLFTALMTIASDPSETGADWVRASLQRYCDLRPQCMRRCEGDSHCESDAAQACSRSDSAKQHMFDVIDYLRVEIESHTELRDKLDVECKAGRSEACSALDPVNALLADDRAINTSKNAVVNALLSCSW